MNQLDIEEISLEISFPPILHIRLSVFWIAVGTLHFHGKFNFTETMLEIVEQLLHHLCKLLHTQQGISLLLEFTGAVIWSLEPFFFWPSSNKQVLLYTSCYHLTKFCVFNRQSLPLICVAFLISRLKNIVCLEVMRLGIGRLWIPKNLFGLPNYLIHKLGKKIVV